ncbi:penicillin-binding transpeptidase domain-containing protein [Anaerocaecibacter muris]|uniref:penicillin-binding transpeptidase domain-containing protein n=1 Tax=Anaerocaecibacter muris TaxID=2941513 RepID=UPI003F68E7BF
MKASASIMRKRILVAFIALAAVFIALFGRLFYLQIIDGGWLRAKAAEQWYRDLPLKAARGKILDCNGETLADSKDVFTLYARPNAVKDKTAVATEIAEALDMEYQTVFDKLNTNVGEVTVKRKIDAQSAYELRKKNISGLYYTLDTQRNYPFGNSLAQILGFTNIDNAGQSGIESYYDKYLTGVDGFAYTSTDMAGRELESSVTKYVPSIPGCNVTLSVDSNIQSFADSAVTAAATEFSAKSASMIVMDVNTGGILAMSKSPSFDLNDPPRNDLDLLNELSRNTMIVDMYEPGSTFKIFTTAAALEAGVVGDNDTFFCAGSRTVDGQRIRCWRSIGHGSQHLAEGVKNSCNCVFMDLALRLGTSRFYSALRNFGMGQKTGVDFTGESSGMMMKEDNVKTVDLARIGFGQAVAVTPLQLITGVCSVINGGTLYKPYLVASVDSYDGKNLATREPQPVRRTVSEATSQKMRDYLVGVVANGGGSKAGVAGYSVGGKTGTAQKYAGGTIAQGKYISSFIGFAPAENPKYAVLMIVDEPQGYMYYGSLVAAPYAGNVFSKIFDYTALPPSMLAEIEYAIMPDVIGKPVADAVKELEDAGLHAELVGEGEKVTAQTPVPQTKIAKNDTVLVRAE